MPKYDAYGYRLLVGFHEWAWSLRTSGFPIWAVFPDGSIHEIGRTNKHPTAYRLPRETVAVIRRYQSNKGYRTYFVYVIRRNSEELEQFEIDERDNFEVPEKLPEPVKVALRGLIEPELEG